MRIRRDIGGLTLGSEAAAKSDPWHPVLDTYARGVQLMKALDQPGRRVRPTSWRWAANTHGIDAATTPRPAWAQCQHQALFFLPWHRAYLAWFEGTIRSLTGEDEWALPYWDYSAPASDRRIPPEFTVPSRTVAGAVVPNPLVSPNRSAAAIPIADVDLRPALSQPNFVLPMEYGFGGVVPDQYPGIAEQLPHNYIHVDIGGATGEMRSPATAGRDPIFWLHHANIDRIWEMWRSLDGSIELPDAEAAAGALAAQWNSADFVFGDERRPTTYAMSELEDLSSPRMDYRYESIELPSAIADEVLAERERILTAQGGGLGLDEQIPEWTPVAATFDVASGEERDVPLEGGLGLDDAPPTRLLLELAGTTAVDPHDAYLVEVRTSPDAEAHVVGRFSTFGLAGTPDDETRNYLVDATNVLPALLDEGWSGSQLVVKVVPEPGRPDSDDPSKAILISQVTIFTQTA
jgi:hypothetical protein